MTEGKNNLASLIGAIIVFVASIIFLAVYTADRNHLMEDVTVQQTVDVSTRAIFDPTLLANQTTLIDNDIDFSAVPGQL